MVKCLVLLKDTSVMAGIRTHILLLTPELESGKLDRSATSRQMVHQLVWKRRRVNLIHFVFFTFSVDYPGEHNFEIIFSQPTFTAAKSVSWTVSTCIEIKKSCPKSSGHALYFTLVRAGQFSLFKDHFNSKIRINVNIQGAPRPRSGHGGYSLVPANILFLCILLQNVYLLIFFHTRFLYRWQILFKKVKFKNFICRKLFGNN